MDARKINEEDHRNGSDQILLLTYSSALYYVQSPSDHSTTNTDGRNNELAFISSPDGSDKYVSTNAPNSIHGQDVSRSLLSRYSSSRGSNNSFIHEKKITYRVNDDFHEKSIVKCGEIDEDDDGRRLILCEKKQKDQHDQEEIKCCEIENDYYDDDDFYEDGRKTGFWRLFSFGTYNSCCWTLIQIFWRILVSFGVALLVFYLATKPPTPKMSIKVAGVPQFRLAEGVDGSGVTTKILDYNCSVALEVDNKSKLFGLHIHPFPIRMSFGPLIFATSTFTSKNYYVMLVLNGPFKSSYNNFNFEDMDSELYAINDNLTRFKLYIGTKNKAMYGAGRSMQDMLESGKGLPLVIKINLRSSFHVVWNYVKPKFSHHAECSLLLHGSYDKLHQTQAYNSYCKIITTKY